MNYKHLLDDSPSKRINLDKEVKKQRDRELHNLLLGSPRKKINLKKEIKAANRMRDIDPLYQFAG